MSLITPDEFDALTRLDFQVFVERVFAELNPSTNYLDNFHIAIICAKLEAVRRGEIKRLIINVPPRSLKSIIASVAFPAFVLGHDPAKRFIGVSYGQELADGLARDCRRVMLTPWYQRVFQQATLSADRRAVHDFVTTTGGGRLATSVGGAITGLGADFIVIDDPTKPSEALSDTERDKANQWYNHTLVSRLNNKIEGAIVLVMQRLHEEDLVGHVLDLEPWEILSFPAIAPIDEHHAVETAHGAYVHHRAEGEALHPAFEPLESLAVTQRTMGTSYFAAQYLQAPMTPGGNMIKEAWFSRYDPDNPPKFDKVFQSSDTASKPNQLSDFSVCTTWGLKAKHCYLISVLRKHLDYPDLKRAVREQAAVHHANTVLIEDRASGIQLIQELMSEGMSGLTRYSPKGDKIMRMQAQTAAIEGGLVHLPSQGHWVEDYLHELMMFPKGRYDDQVDSTSQALDWARNGDDFEAWKEFLTNQWGGPARGRDQVPTIRVRHTNRSMQLGTLTGRQLSPSPDGGWFLLTEEEWGPLSGLPDWTRDN